MNLLEHQLNHKPQTTNHIMKLNKMLNGGYYTLGAIAKAKGINSSDPQRALANAGYSISYNYDGNGDRFFNVTKKAST
ncbi:MAG: hypothetical protein ACR2PH_12800 [Desulfobulbia bacterium]